ncbi:hypothetical protein BSP239C_02628 [Brevibacterium sp. 239c]|nr:hypothetical protein BSP239C_02628 [Brevibacterium sp. 239c]
MMLLITSAPQDEVTPSHLVQTTADSLSQMLSRHVELEQLFGCQHPEHSIIMPSVAIKHNETPSIGT